MSENNSENLGPEEANRGDHADSGEPRFVELSGTVGITTAFSGELLRRFAPNPGGVDQEARSILSKVTLFCQNPGEFLFHFPGRDVDPRYGIEYHPEDWLKGKDERELNYILIAWQRLVAEGKVVVESSNGKRYVRPADTVDSSRVCGQSRSFGEAAPNGKITIEEREAFSERVWSVLNRLKDLYPGGPDADEIDPMIRKALRLKGLVEDLAKCGTAIQDKETGENIGETAIPIGLTPRGAELVAQWQADELLGGTKAVKALSRFLYPLKEVAGPDSGPDREQVESQSDSSGKGHSTEGKEMGDQGQGDAAVSSSEVAEIPCYVTLNQMAGSVNRHKSSLKKLLSREKNPLAPPDIPGKGGKPHEWEWTRIRPWLEQEFGRKLPERFPTSRFQR